LSAARACLQLLDIAVTSPQSLDMTPEARLMAAPKELQYGISTV
jgi:hypothetical protein